MAVTSMSSPVLRRRWALGCALVAMLVVVQMAAASYGVATGATGAALRVDAKGDAEVSWAQGGVHHSFIVPPSGAGYYGTLAGGDISRRAKVALPMAVAVRVTPDGRVWALQQLAVSGRVTSLDLSRWQGATTQLAPTTDGKRLRGRATFHGHPVTGSSPTRAGKAVRVYVYLDCFGCPGRPSGWTAMLAVAPKADGSFSVYLRPSWVGRRYRATVQGPNVGAELAPDAQAIINAAR
jgi:hypothetical protein